MKISIFVNMESERTSIELLNDFARKTNRKVESSEKPYPTAKLHRVTYHRRTLFMPNDVNEGSYFVCFGDSREFGNYAVFSGVFTSIDIPSSSRIIVRNKDILDKLNPFGKKKYCKTGIPTFDAMTRIEANDPVMVKKIFQERKMQNLVKHAIKLDPGIIISINDADVDFVPGLKGKSQLGIFITREWILDPRLIERLFNIFDGYLAE
jgi:hypothetical protein